MNKKSGFTLAEVLVTLMIIGVIAAMTIPSLMQSTAQQEYRAAYKKTDTEHLGKGAVRKRGDQPRHVLRALFRHIRAA